VNIFQLLILVKKQFSVTRRFIWNNAISIFTVYIQPYSEFMMKQRKRNKVHAFVYSARAHIFVGSNSIQVRVRRSIPFYYLGK